jgi:hypothetical protein
VNAALPARASAALAFAALACARGAPAVPRRLSETGLYADLATHAVRPENLPYDPQYPLWTDGAEKRRWIFLPPGSAIDASQPDAWVFPRGTKLWKEFSFGRRVETRYMERAADGSWIYASYVWDDEGRDAALAPTRGLARAAAIRPGVAHDVPGLSDCKACHQGRATEVLGFDALQLSPDRDPLAPHAAPDPGGVDLPALVARGLVRGLPGELLARPPRVAARSPRERAALGYLYGNCSHCHRADGPLAPLGLALEIGVATAPGGAPALLTAVGRASRWRLPGAEAGQTLRIAPGAPERSALAARMQAHGPLARMPPIGTSLVDDDAVRLVDAWIREDLRPFGGDLPVAHP